jgi:hypothetical protein
VTLAYAVTRLYAYENEEPGDDEGNDAVVSRPVPRAHAHLVGMIRVLCAAVNFQDPARCSIT